MILSLSHIASEARKRLHLCKRYLPHRHKLSPKNFPEWRPYNRISKGERFFQEYQPESLLNKSLKVSQCWCSLRYCPGVRLNFFLKSPLKCFIIFYATRLLTKDYQSIFANFILRTNQR